MATLVLPPFLGRLMDLLLFHVEIAALSAVLVMLYASRVRLGLAPLYVAAGLLMGFMLIGSRIKIPAPIVGGGHERYVSMGHLPLLLVTIALVYTLEGTKEARKFIAGIVVVKVLINGMKALVAWRLLNSGIDVEIYGRDRWLRVGLQSSVVSTLAILAACVSLVVVYQAGINASRRWRLRIPFVVPLTLALVAAMLVDGTVYSALTGRLHKLNTYVVAKFLAGFAVAGPAATFIAWQLRRTPADVRSGVLERSALDMVTLTRRLKQMDAALHKSQEQVAHVKQVFGRYVAPDVVEDILADASQLELGGAVRDVTILFADIRGYSTLSEHMSPTQVIGLLNEYFGAMSDIIDANRGTIIEFEGDAILAVFGAPLLQPDHAARAVRTAEGMLTAVDMLNRRWDADGTSKLWQSLAIPDFRIRIGVHTGRVVVGNVGSETRTKYAVIGDSVNIAARIEQMNKKLGTWALISGVTRDAAGDMAQSWTSLGEQAVRGRSEGVEVFGYVDSERPAEGGDSAG
ncbi:MAG: adenylate/guanylate cyclase domain-containing protein [Myxococcales bacterium]|nr:adenylate/guanylate cyclase domain-containing protein [Myxococcales bacterium]